MTGGVLAMDTAAWADGDKLYLSATTAGALTNAMPVHPNITQTVGVVEVSGVGNGSLLVSCIAINPHEYDGVNGTSWAIGDGTGTTKSYLVKNAGGTGTLSWNPTANRTLTLPDVTGTVAVTSDLAAYVSVFVADTAPVGAPDNSLFWESDSGNLYIRYNDGDTTQWTGINVAGPPGPAGSNAWADITGVPATFPPTTPIAQASITDLTTDLGLKAPLASPTFTGTAASVTPAVGDNSTTIATTALGKEPVSPEQRRIRSAIAGDQHSRRNPDADGGDRRGGRRLLPRQLLRRSQRHDTVGVGERCQHHQVSVSEQDRRNARSGFRHRARQGVEAMSGHAAFRRQPVPGEMALRHQTVTLPAPIRGIIENENWAYTKPGCAVILDNWFPTQKGLKLRGGTERWLMLPDPVEVGTQRVRVHQRRSAAHVRRYTRRGYST